MNQKPHCPSERGNVLFLILIAVALFAALSYAVTQSTRSSGGDASSETASILAGQLLQQATAFKTEITRLYAMNKVDQVYFDNSTYNANGTVFLPDGTTGTGRTKGIFDMTDGGTPVLYPPLALHETGSPPPAWGWVYDFAAVTVNGVDVGTNSNDEYLFVGAISLAVCEHINKKINGSTNIPLYSVTVPAGNGAIQEARMDGSFLTTPTGIRFDLGVLPGCNKNASNSNAYFDIVKEN